MRKQITILLLFVLTSMLGQEPAGYYDDAEGLTGEELKTALYQIISPHTTLDYGDLWDAYYTTDVDKYYENDGTVLDMYSENPSGTDPYNYTLGSDQCGNYDVEGDCYNREHSFPKSWFNDASPMYTDIFHIYPTDGYVNGKRGNYPYGEVGQQTDTIGNGCKLGPNTYPGYSGTVFEPIDEFKGDLARTYFYMATCYENEIASWEYNNDNGDAVLNGTSYPCYEDWFLQMLLDWHNQDPVSQREIDRNNAAYDVQGNRNPFIDHPEWVAAIWDSDSIPDTESPMYLVEENFDGCINDDMGTTFVSVNEASDKNWSCTDQYGENNSPAIQMNGYEEDVPSKDWLITAQKINFDDYTNEKLYLFVADTYGSTPLELLYSADYDGNGFPQNFTWTTVPNVNIPDPNGTSTTVETLITDADISAITGSVYIAFKYYSDGSPTRWTVDSFKISANDATVIDQYLSQKVKLYPNPLSKLNELKISLPDNTYAESFSLFDISGKQVYFTQVNDQNFSVQLNRIPGGIYLVQIQTNAGSVHKKLIIE